jgi:aminoglycoside 6-adenylyltransferase
MRNCPQTVEKKYKETLAYKNIRRTEMRNEQEMMDTLLTFAKNDDCIRVVTMEGSRLNKNAPKDRFQDFDVSFIVTDMKKYKNNDNWLDVFGKKVIMQKPEGMAMFPPTLGNWCSY